MPTIIVSNDPSVQPAPQYTTITDALAVARDGDIVQVLGGSYTENNLTVPTNVQLVATAVSTINGLMTLAATSRLDGFAVFGNIIATGFAVINGCDIVNHTTSPAIRVLGDAIITSCDIRGDAVGIMCGSGTTTVTDTNIFEHDCGIKSSTNGAVLYAENVALDCGIDLFIERGTFGYFIGFAVRIVNGGGDFVINAWSQDNIPATGQGLVTTPAVQKLAGLALQISITGYLIDQHVLHVVKIKAAVINLPNNSQQYIVISPSGTLTAVSTIPQSGVLLFAWVGTRNNDWEFINVIASAAGQISGDNSTVIFADDCNTSVIAPGKLNVNPGLYYINNVGYPFPGKSPDSTFGVYSGTSYVGRRDHIENLYVNKNSAALETIPSGKFAKISVFILGGDSQFADVYAVYGAELWDTFAAAKNSTDAIVMPSYFINGIVMTAEFVLSQSDVISVDPRGNNGQPDQSLTSDLDCAGYGLHNVGGINGVDLLNIATRFLPNGADALSTAAPSRAIGGTSTNSAGSANSFARSDHSHVIDTSTILLSSLGGILPVSRGGTGVTSIAAGAILAGGSNNTINAIAGPIGAIVGTTDIQILTNKTLTCNANNILEATSLRNVAITGSAPGLGGILVADSSNGASWRSVIDGNGAIKVNAGGTGQASLTPGAVLTGNGAGPVVLKAGPVGAFVGATDVQTLTNKTLLSSAQNVIDATMINGVPVSSTAPQIGQLLSYVPATGWTPASIVPGFAWSQFAIVKDSSVLANGGDLLANTWTTRNITAAKGGFAPQLLISNNKLSVPAGNYLICATTLASGLGLFRARLWDATNSVELAQSRQFGSITTASVGNILLAIDELVSLAQPIDIQLQVFSTVTNLLSGLGMQTLIGVPPSPNNFSTISLTKLS